jgi:ankyrin repeat protein
LIEKNHNIRNSTIQTVSNIASKIVLQMQTIANEIPKQYTLLKNYFFYSYFPEPTAVIDEDSNPLHDAIRTNYPEIVETLIANGAELNCSNSNGHNALHLALLHNLLEVAKILIEKGADPNCPDKEGSTPLHYVLVLCLDKISTETINIFKLLIEKGADLNFPNKIAETPLHIALRFKLPEIAKILIEKALLLTVLTIWIRFLSLLLCALTIVRKLSKCW